jgi:hypothetical protein
VSSKPGAGQSAQLKDTKFSIIVLTGEALKSDWIMFEAGATANAVGRTRACPLLFGLEPADVRGPLASLQLTRFTREDFSKLFKTINAAIGEGKLEEPVLTSVFGKWWPDLEKRVAEVLASAPPPKRPKRDTNEMVEETLLLVRGIQNSLEAIPERNERQLRRTIRNYVVHRGNVRPLYLDLLEDNTLERNLPWLFLDVSSDTPKSPEGKPEDKNDQPPKPAKE